MQQSITSFRDSEVRSAGDIMRQAGIPAKPVDYITGKVISRKPLSGSTKYSYCPYCLGRAKLNGQDYKTVLRPLQSVTYKNLYRVDANGGAKILIETELECTACRERDGHPKRITLDDFSKAYSEPYREESGNFVDSNDIEELKKAGFAEYAENLTFNNQFA